jgi:hypothetical protein
MAFASAGAFGLFDLVPTGDLLIRTFRVRVFSRRLTALDAFAVLINRGQICCRRRQARIRRTFVSLHPRLSYGASASKACNGRTTASVGGQYHRTLL